MRPNRTPLKDVNETHQITICKGKLALIDNDHLIFLTSPVILNNGAIVSMDGMIKMPDGTKRTLLEGEYV